MSKRSEWQTEKDNAIHVIAERTGRWHKEAKELLLARLGPGCRGEGLSVDQKIERLADVLIEILEEQGGLYMPHVAAPQFAARRAA